MSTLDNLKEWLASSNPGLVTREDLARVEEKLDELAELLDEIEERVSPTDRSEDGRG